MLQIDQARPVLSVARMLPSLRAIAVVFIIGTTRGQHSERTRLNPKHERTPSSSFQLLVSLLVYEHQARAPAE